MVGTEAESIGVSKVETSTPVFELSEEESMLTCCSFSVSFSLPAITGFFLTILAIEGPSEGSILFNASSSNSKRSTSLSPAR